MKALKRTLILCLALFLVLGAVACAPVMNTDETNEASASDSASDSSSESNSESLSDTGSDYADTEDTADITDYSDITEQPITSDTEGADTSTESSTPSESETSQPTSETDTVQNIEGTGPSTGIDLSNYTIITEPENTYANTAATMLTTLLSKKGITLSTDQTNENVILIGNGSSVDAKEVALTLDGTNKDHIIKFTDKKIIITSKSDATLSEACDIFYNTYIKALSGSSLTVKDGATTIAMSPDFAVLAFNKNMQYEIVYGNVNDNIKNKVNTDILPILKSVCGTTNIKVGAKYDDTKSQIIIGSSFIYAETKTALNSMKSNEYAVKKINNKVIVAGKSTDTTMLAVDILKNILTAAKAINNTKGTFAINLSKTYVEEYSVALANLPNFTGGTLKNTYTIGTGITQKYYTGADKTKIKNYANQLSYLGYPITEENTRNGNLFLTCYGKGGVISFSYLRYNSSLSIVFDSLSTSVYKASEPTYKKVTDTSIAVMSLDYDCGTQTVSNGKYDASGMSYVITLEDGRYVIFDGGYGKTGSKDYINLFNYLKNNNKRPDKKIIIAAWIFTHDHSDHHGVFTPFTQNYASQVELQYYIQNCGEKSRFDQQPSGWVNGGLISHLIPYYKNAKKIIPHTGQKITFCNTTFELMSTHENHAPDLVELVNDASLIFRMETKGVSALFLADTEAQTTSRLINMYGSTLKSDIMQIAHHGFSGGSVALYELINPTWSLWPTSQECFNQRTTGGGNGNAQTQNKWVRDHTTCYIGDGDMEILSIVGGTTKIKVTMVAPQWS